MFKAKIVDFNPHIVILNPFWKLRYQIFPWVKIAPKKLRKIAEKLRKLRKIAEIAEGKIAGIAEKLRTPVDVAVFEHAHIRGDPYLGKGFLEHSFINWGHHMAESQ